MKTFNMVEVVAGKKVLGLLIRASLIIILFACQTGCFSLKPWVKPYERQNLADPIMSSSRHGLANNYMHHVYQSREGSRGAEGGAGGGCGCN